MSTIELYHFTSPYYLPSILSEQRLRMTFSEVDFPRAGEPYVVWLTDDPKRDARRERHPSSPHEIGVDKMGVRFTVRLPRSEVIRWKWFARKHGMTDEAYSLLNYASANTSSSWYVIEREIPAEEWHEVTDTTTARSMSRSVWPEVTRLLPEWQEIDSHTYTGQHNVKILPGAMKGRLDRFARQVADIIRDA